MATAKRTRKPSRPFWERGYHSHGYWLAEVLVGRVEVEPGSHLEMKYRWRVGNYAGQSTTLLEAKRNVERAFLMGGRQLPLFPEDDPDAPGA